MSDEFRIYVASLTDYNNGILHGAWLDFDDFESAGEVWEAVEDMLKASPTAARTGYRAEEYAIHDFEGWCGVRLGEYERIEALWRAYEVLSKMLDDDKCEPEAIRVYAEYIGAGIAEIDDEFRDEFDDRFSGRWDCETDFAEDLLTESGMLDEVPEGLRGYIDYEEYGRYLFMANYYRDYETGYVFRTN